MANQPQTPVPNDHRSGAFNLIELLAKEVQEKLPHLNTHMSQINPATGTRLAVKVRGPKAQVNIISGSGTYIAYNTRTHAVTNYDLTEPTSIQELLDYLNHSCT